MLFGAFTQRIFIFNEQDPTRSRSAILFAGTWFRFGIRLLYFHRVVK